MAVITSAACVYLSGCAKVASDLDKKTAEQYGLSIDDYINNRDNIDIAVSKCASNVTTEAGKGLDLRLAPGTYTRITDVSEGNIHVESNNLTSLALDNTLINYKCDYNTKTYVTSFTISDS